MLSDNNGMTMIEVLMGFTILILFLAGMSGIIAFSNNLVLRSVDLRKDTEVIQSEMYKIRNDKNNNMYMKLSGDITLEKENGNSTVIVAELKDAEVIAYDSDKMKQTSLDISDEGLGIRYYILESK